MDDDFTKTSAMVTAGVAELAARADASGVQVMAHEARDPVVGEWYWLKIDATPTVPEHRELVCVTEVGSNYAGMQSPFRQSWRVHFNDFDDECIAEPDPDAYIDTQVREHQSRVQNLLGRVREVTARLHLAPMREIGDGAGETRALARVGAEGDVGAYKTALIEAKQTVLPKLFEQIREANEALALWMTAKTIPLKAAAEGLKGLVGGIESRIFNVELYAGLTETCTVVAEGEPAQNDTPVHLMQRRCYMDEECLAEYRAGGMDFTAVGDFGRWLAEPANRDRLLPFPRCIVAFRVRRHQKDRRPRSWLDILRFIKLAEADQSTFLYIRNGDQVYCLETAIDFGPHLFPDIDREHLSGGEPLWAKVFGTRIDSLISQGEYEGIVAKYQADLAEFEANKAAIAAATTDEERRRLPHPWYPHERLSSYVPWSPENTYYDDISKHVAADIEKHNRIVLVLQGLLDRSPVLHPHPPWQLWTPAGFTTAIRLVRDGSRALTPGPAPDFDAYRARVNASLAVGSVTVGQHIQWMMAEADKENRRRRRERRRDWEAPELEMWEPWGDQGPGRLARVEKVSPRAKRVTYSWTRERTRRTWAGENRRIPVSFSCSIARVLNVSAYTPGDFRQFFADPRTRADYLQWAPLLLEAEEYHAGNRKL